MHHIFKQQFSVVASASEQGWLNISFNAYNQMLDGKSVRSNFGLIQGYEFWHSIHFHQGTAKSRSSAAFAFSSLGSTIKPCIKDFLNTI